VRERSPSDVLAIADAEQLLLGLDEELEHGSGGLLESAGHELFFRVLVQGSLSGSCDLLGTLTRLRPAIEHPFVDVTIDWSFSATSRGFAVFLVVPQRPRSARILQHMVSGAIHASQRYVTRLMGDPVRIFSETIGDRVSLDVHMPSSQRERADTIDFEADRRTTDRPPSDRSSSSSAITSPFSRAALGLRSEPPHAGADRDAKPRS
jgi:hypothetical protein